MASNFFKLLDTYKTNYGKILTKDLERIKKIEKDRNSFLKSLSSWINKYNKYISSKNYKGAVLNYVKSFEDAIDSLKSHLEDIHSFYNSDGEAIKNELGASGLTVSHQNNILSKLKNLSSDFSTIQELVNKSYVVKGAEYINGDNSFKKPYLSFTYNGNSVNIPLNYYDFLTEKNNSSNSTNYVFYRYNKDSFDYSKLFDVDNSGDSVRIKIKGLIGYNDSDDALLESYDDYKSYYSDYYYSIKGNTSDGDQKTLKTIFNETSLNPILAFYNFLLVCRNVEIKRYKALYDKISGKKSVFSEISDILKEIKSSYLKWKKNLNKIVDSNEDRETALENYIRIFLWGSTNNSISDIGSGKINSFKKGVTVEEINSFLIDKTNKKAKDVQEIYDFIKNFLIEIENYDIDKKIVIDENYQNLSLEGVSKTQFSDLKSVFDSFVKTKDNNNYEDVFSFSDNSEIFDDGSKDSIFIIVDSDSIGIKVSTFYEEDADSNNKKNLLYWDDKNSNLREITKEDCSKHYYMLNGDSSYCFPQGLFANLSDSTFITKGGLRDLTNYYIKTDNAFTISNSNINYNPEIMYIIQKDGALEDLTSSETYNSYMKEAATLASIYNNQTGSEISEKIEYIDKDISESETSMNKLKSTYDSAISDVNKINSEEIEIVVSGYGD